MKKKDTIKATKPNQDMFKIATIAAATAFNVEEDDIVNSERRPDPLARARQITYWIMRKGSTMTLAEIGSMFGKPKDHGTILHGFRTIEGMFEVGDKPCNKYYRPSVKAVNMFKEMHKKYAEERRRIAEEKLKEVING